MRFFISHLEAFARRVSPKNLATRQNLISVFHEADLESIRRWQEILKMNGVGVDDLLTYRLELNHQPAYFGVVVEIPQAVSQYLREKSGSVTVDLKWPLILGSLFRPDEFLPDSNPLKGKPIVLGEILRSIEKKPEEDRCYPLERQVTDYCFGIGVLPYEPVIQHTVREHMPKEMLASACQHVAAAG